MAKEQLGVSVEETEKRIAEVKIEVWLIGQ